MKTKTYKQAEAIHRSVKTSWRPPTESMINSRMQYGFDQALAKKILDRKRRRSHHPLRDLRLHRGFTLAELANLTKLSPSYLSRLEGGSRRFNTDILLKLAQVLSCHPGDLLFNDSLENTHAVPVLSLAESKPHERRQEARTKVSPLNTPDLPLYQLKTLNNEACAIELESPLEWIKRPQELLGVPGAISFQVSTEYDSQRYKPGDHIFAHPTRPLSQNCSVLVITHDNRAHLGEFMGWDSHQENNDRLALRIHQSSKKSSLPDNDVTYIDNNAMKAVYRIIGLIEAP